MKLSGRQWAGWALRITIFLLLVAVIGVFQVDRHSRTRLTLMAYVPAGLGGFADANAGRILALHAPEMAVERAEASLRHRPVDAGTLSAFALAAVEGDDVERAGKALSLAAKRGWRDTYTQVMVVGSALSGEKWDVAAQRIDALTRLQREEQAIFGSLSMMLRNEGGRGALADRLPESNPLVFALADFLGNYPEFGPEVAEVFVTARSAAPDMPCSSFSRVTRTLLARDHGDMALAVWPEKCIGEDAETIAFSMDGSEEDPFSWSYPSAAGLSVRRADEPDAINIRNRDRLRRPFATRYLTLEPGPHRLTIERESAAAVRPGASSGAADLQVDLRCDRSSTSKFAALVSQTYETPIRFEVPPECLTQYVTLSISSGSAEQLTISVD